MKLRSIVTFLRGIGQTSAVAAEYDDVDVDGVAADAVAGAGALSWMSERVARREPSRARSFRGALLIVPAWCDSDPARGVVPCTDPKLAFIRAVAEFFPELGEITWPRQHEDPIASDAVIDPTAVLGRGVVIGPGVRIGAGATIGPNSCIANTTIGSRVRIGCNCTIGMPGFGYERDTDGIYRRFPHVGDVVIEDDVEIGSNTCIDRGALGSTSIRRGCKIDNLVHVAHNVDAGTGAMLIAHAMIGGSARIGAGAWIAPSAAVMNQIEVGEGAIVGMGAVVVKSVAAGSTVVGNPAKPLARKDDT